MARANRTYWNETAEVPSFPPLSGDLNVDIAIIGGGIVGITTARLLKDQGLKVAVVEARRVDRAGSLRTGTMFGMIGTRPV